MAIDERRAFYRQNTFEEADGQTLKELWFAGVHSDIGGGYSKKEGSLWAPPFVWLVNEAKEQGLTLDEERLKAVLEGTPAEPWKDRQHESLKGPWWIAEIIPKWSWQEGERRIRFNRGRPRWIPPGALIHKSALLRLRQTGYRPKNFSERFVRTVLELEDVPEAFTFEW